MPQGEEGRVAGAASSAGNAHTPHTEPPREPGYVDGDSSLQLLADLQELVLSLEHGDELFQRSSEERPLPTQFVTPDHHYHHYHHA